MQLPKGGQRRMMLDSTAGATVVVVAMEGEIMLAS